MPYGYGQLSAGECVAPAMRSVLADYLSHQATIDNSSWYPLIPGVTTDNAANAAPVLPEYTDVGSEPWAGEIMGRAGLTALCWIRALYLVGDGTCDASTIVPGEDSSGSGRVQGPIGYYPGPTPPQVAGVTVPDFPWAPLPRIDPNNWGSIGHGFELWCAIDCCISVGQWQSADGLGAPFIPAAEAPSLWTVLPHFCVLLAALPAGKWGAPTLYTPLSWAYLPYTGDSGLDFTACWADCRAQVGPWLDALEQQDGTVFGAPAVGATAYRPGFAQARRIGLR